MCTTALLRVGGQDFILSGMHCCNSFQAYRYILCNKLLFSNSTKTFEHSNASRLWTASRSCVCALCGLCSKELQPKQQPTCPTYEITPHLLVQTDYYYITAIQVQTTSTGRGLCAGSIIKTLFCPLAASRALDTRHQARARYA